FHEAFAEYLRKQSENEDIDRAYVDEMWKPMGTRDSPDLREPYALHYLPAHAARAGMLDQLIIDPEFLLSVSPTGLAPYLTNVTSAAARRAAASYRSAAHWMSAESTPERVSRLHLAAHQRGARGLANAVMDYPHDPACTPRWSSFRRSIASDVLARADEDITAMAIHEVEGDAFLIVATSSRLAVWSTASRTALSRSEDLHATVILVSVYAAADGHWIVAVANHGTELISLEFPSLSVVRRTLHARAPV